MTQKNPPMATVSQVPTTLRGGVESPFVIDAVAALLDGRPDDARAQLAAGAGATSWAAVAHRVEVAGRNLAAEVFDGAALAELEASALGAVDDESVAAAEVLSGWWERGTTADIDLEEDVLDIRSSQERLWAALVAVAWSVERSGFPPEVIA